jgi:hypothetical protein
MLCRTSVPHAVAKLEIAEEPGPDRCRRCVTLLGRIVRRPPSMDNRDFRNVRWG